MKKLTLRDRTDIVNAIAAGAARIYGDRHRLQAGVVYVAPQIARTMVYSPGAMRITVRKQPRIGDAIIQIPATTNAADIRRSIHYSLTHRRHVRTIGIIDGDRAVSQMRRTRWIHIYSAAVIDDRGGVWAVDDRTATQTIRLHAHILPTSARMRVDVYTIAGDRTAPAIANSLRWLDHWDGQHVGDCHAWHRTALSQRIDYAADMVREAVAEHGVDVTLAQARRLISHALDQCVPCPGTYLEACGYHARMACARIAPEQVDACTAMLCTADGAAWIRHTIRRGKAQKN